MMKGWQNGGNGDEFVQKVVNRGDDGRGLTFKNIGDSLHLGIAGWQDVVVRTTHGELVVFGSQRKCVSRGELFERHLRMLKASENLVYHYDNFHWRAQENNIFHLLIIYCTYVNKTFILIISYLIYTVDVK